MRLTAFRAPLRPWGEASASAFLGAPARRFGFVAPQRAVQKCASSYIEY